MNPEDTQVEIPSPTGKATVAGMRWAAGLGVALLLTLTLLTATRWLGKPAAAAEEIVQIPPARTSPTPTPPAELLAPDPGDHP